jgi:N6-adenosine-specific RNA methylase IME4
MTDGRPKTILMDPPWLERGGGNRGADSHYDLMSSGEIYKTIMSAKLEGEFAFRPAPDCHLWCWVTDNYLLDALSLIHRFGFRYIRTIVWVKVATEIAIDGSTVEVTDALDLTVIQLTNFQRLAAEMLQIGLGQYSRGSHELLLLATRGKAMVPPPERRPPSVIFAPRGEHSEKPDASYELIEQISPGPRVEFFARRARAGWKHWGKEAPTEEPA